MKRNGDGFTIAQALRENPFAITKAVDFTDDEIDTMWVEWPSEGGFAEMLDVKSPMPRIVLGGKGTGRTHVMRHFSAPVQVIRGGEHRLAQIIEDGVLGIYVLCSGLNSSRFHGRGIDDETWRDVFSQYMDIWLAEAAVDAFRIATVDSPPSNDIERAISNDVHKLLQDTDVPSGTSLSHLREDLHRMQRRIDLAVNNAALNPNAHHDIVIHSTPGTLVFGIAEALQRHYRELKDVKFLYLIDELENFDVPQQMYVNTLVREKKAGTTFMIGVRTYGLRTLKTFSGGEENRRGSEYEEIRPDRNYTAGNQKTFEDFCHRVVARRLSEFGILESNAHQVDLRERLIQFFEVPPREYVEELICRRYSHNNRPYLIRLKDDLSSHSKAFGGAPLAPREVEMIVEATRVPSRPLLEKVNVFMIYRAWAAGEDLTTAAQNMIDGRLHAGSSGVVPANDVQKSVLEHYSTDLRAQLLNDIRHPQLYAGIEDFIAMSEGLPRNLLVILKNIYRWAVFNGEKPFRGDPISWESQRMGVLDSAEWFFSDSKPLGEDGEHVHAAIHRLADMFRQFRFTDKPAECSLSSFSTDLTTCTQRASEVIDLAEKWSLLVRAEQGQKQRNTGRIEPKFHLNRLLSPRWDLPIWRRGAIRLNSDEVNAIFDPNESHHYEAILDRRLVRMKVPFGRGRSRSGEQKTFDLDS